MQSVRLTDAAPFHKVAPFSDRAAALDFMLFADGVVFHIQPAFRVTCYQGREAAHSEFAMHMPVFRVH